MNKILKIALSIISLISTQSFASSINVVSLKKITKEAVSAKEGTGTCIGRNK